MEQNKIINKVIHLNHLILTLWSKVSTKLHELNTKSSELSEVGEIVDLTHDLLDDLIVYSDKLGIEMENVNSYMNYVMLELLGQKDYKEAYELDKLEKFARYLMRQQDYIEHINGYIINYKGTPSFKVSTDIILNLRKTSYDLIHNLVMSTSQKVDERERQEFVVSLILTYIKVLIILGTNLQTYNGIQTL